MTTQRAKAGFILIVLTALGLPTPVAVASHPLTPLQARGQITTYFNRIYYDMVSDPGDMAIQTETVRPGQLVITGACAPSSLDIHRVVDDSRAGQTVVQCQRLHGHHITTHIARNKMPYSQQLHVSYAPLLGRLGERAASSVGLADAEHGLATSAFDSATDLNITYARNPAAATNRQLRRLRLHVQRGRESVQEIWYVSGTASVARLHHKPGITLSGPLTDILLNTKYTYTVQVVTARSYRHAVVSFTVPASVCLIRRTVNLTAHRPWRDSYTVEYRTTNEMDSEGIGVAVFTPPSRRGSHAIVGRAYQVTPVPGQVPQYPPPPGAPCPQPLLGS